jgi:hypothetical protein
MMLKRSGIVVVAALSLSLLQCVSPQDNDNGGADDGDGGAGGSTAKGGTSGKGGSGGSSAKGGTLGSTGGTEASTGGTQGSTGGTQGSTGGTQGSTGGTQGSTGGSPGSGGSDTPDMGGGSGGTAGGSTFTTVYNMVIKPGCGCHTGANSPGGLRMQTAMAGYMALVGVDSMGCTGMKRVTAGDPTKSVLSLILKAAVPGCAMRKNTMPKGKAVLPKAQVDMVDAWIMDGAAM